jgi:porin
LNWARRTRQFVASSVLTLVPGAAFAAPTDKLPPLTIAARETFDAFDVPAGTHPGTAILNKLQLSATLRGERFGLNGWLLHTQIIRFDGQSLSKHLGDIQAADNIEAVPVTRLFEAYLAKTWGADQHSIGVRIGMMDLNSQFDSIDTATLMLNSSHGIGPDLSRSGRTGPSIYPVTAIGTSVTWVPSQQWTFRFGAYDGVSGSPAAPKAFFAERLKANDGLLLIGQADWQKTKSSRLEAGVWGYTAPQRGPARKAHDHGAYVSYEAPLALAPHLSFWLRGGLANSDAQPIARYVGGGVVQQGTIPGRPDDRLAFAIAHAIIGDPAVDVLGLHKAETSLEVTYQLKISHRFIVQPDVDYVHRPAGIPHARDSVGIGLRFVLVAAYPTQMTASDPGDPTVPPDGSPSGNTSDQ